MLKSFPTNGEFAKAACEVIYRFTEEKDFVKELIQDFYLDFFENVLEDQSSDSTSLLVITLLTGILSREQYVEVLGRHNIYRKLSNRIISANIGTGLYDLILSVLVYVTHKGGHYLPESSAGYWFEDSQGGKLIKR